MRIKSFPKTFVESFTLTQLRLVCKRVEEYCYTEETSKLFPFIKWEQTLSLQKLNKRVISSTYRPSNEFQLDRIKSLGYSDFDRKRIYFLDLELLTENSVLNLLSKRHGMNDFKDILLQQSKSYLMVTRKSRLNKAIRVILKNNFNATWVGLDPNLIVNTNMNSYFDLDNVFETCFTLIKP